MKFIFCIVLTVFIVYPFTTISLLLLNCAMKFLVSNEIKIKSCPVVVVFSILLLNKNQNIQKQKKKAKRSYSNWVEFKAYWIFFLCVCFLYVVLIVHFQFIKHLLKRAILLQNFTLLTIINFNFFLFKIVACAFDLTACVCTVWIEH